MKARVTYLHSFWMKCDLTTGVLHTMTESMIFLTVHQILNRAALIVISNTLIVISLAGSVRPRDLSRFAFPQKRAICSE